VVKKLLALLFLAVVVGGSLYLVWSRERGVRAEGTLISSTNLHPAMHWEARAGGMVRCGLCPHRCMLSEGQIGICRARKNEGGKLYSLVYGKLAAAHVDPIEKKPFFHVLPASKSFSIATPGCNMRCLFCQNWEIAQAFPWDVQTTDVAPDQVVEAALKSGARSIAFTYTEPIIYYEYMLDIAKRARQRGLKTVVVSNGFINPEPLKELLEFIDAYKVDLKAFNDRFYDEFTGGDLESILRTLKIIRESGVWLEIVTLLVPGQNDSEEEVRKLARWVKENLGPDVPLHFSRFHPQHKLRTLPPTPVQTVIRAREIAVEEGLHYVYTGNVRHPEGESTYCPETGELAIERQGYFVVRNNLKDGKCPSGCRVPGVWE